MKTRNFKKLTGALILFLAFTLHVSAQGNEETLVKKAFNGYKTSILNDKGEEAVSYVDSRTIKYYSEILELVKHADSLKVENSSVLDKLMIFSIRHRTAKEDILSFDGKSLLIYAIKSGMVGKNSVADISIDDITVNDDFAKGQLVSKEQKLPFYFNFYKEEGRWKINLTSLFTISTSAIKKMADDSGMNQNEYLFTLLEITTGKKPGSEIWKPIKL